MHSESGRIQRNRFERERDQLRELFLNVIFKIIICAEGGGGDSDCWVLTDVALRRWSRAHHVYAQRLGQIGKVFVKDVVELEDVRIALGVHRTGAAAWDSSSVAPCKAQIG